mgnify:CR=1 FL=1
MNTEIEEEIENEEVLEVEGNEEVEETPEDIEAREAAEALAKENEDIHPDFQGLGQKAKIKAQKRFNKMTAKNYDLMDRANASDAKSAALEERLAQIEQRLTGGGSTETPVTPATIDRDDFDSEEEWIEKLTEVKAEQIVSKALKAKEVKAEKVRLQAAEKEHTTSTIENFKAKTVEAMAANDDYLDVTSSISIPLESPLGQEILDSKEHGAQIMYVLGKDPDLFNSVNTLTGKQLTKAIGKLESSLEGKKTPIKKKIQVPKPANVNRRATNHTGTKKSLKELTPDEYYRQQCSTG